MDYYQAFLAYSWQIGNVYSLAVLFPAVFPHFPTLLFFLYLFLLVMFAFVFNNTIVLKVVPSCCYVVQARFGPYMKLLFTVVFKVFFFFSCHM